LEDPQSLEDHFMIAMQFEGPNLCVLGAAIKHARHGQLVAETIRALVQASREEQWCRRLWFLYEWMSEDRLDVDDLGDSVAYVDVLDATEYYTGRPILSTRHGVRDNLLGCRGFCPVVRRTPLLAKYASQNYGQMALELLNKHGRVLARDYSYDMVLQETIHSMTIEGVDYDSYDVPALVKTLMKHGNLDDVPLDENAVKQYILPAVMSVTELPDYSFAYREQQVYVSETICTVDDTKDLIHFIAAKSDDCPDMVGGLFCTLERMWQDITEEPGSIDSVVAASMLGFGMVFIHPFEDGNGRVHRFFIQPAGRRCGSVPHRLFPVSRGMVREPEKYMSCLNNFDAQTMPHITYTIAGDGEMVILNDTDHLYRYFDSTAMAEYLYECVHTCVEDDLPTYCSLMQSTWDHVYV
jgi:hypothetical protein